MIKNIWECIREKEKQLDHDPLAWELIDDPQEYYHWLYDNHTEHNTDSF